MALIIDPGNSNFKSRDGKGKEMKTLSVIANSQDAFSEKPLWKIDNHYIGKNAILYGNTKKYSLDEIKTEQSTFQIISKYFLCNHTDENKIVFLFPYESYFTEKKKIINMFSRHQDIDYEIGNVKYTHRFRPIMVKSLPQGFCAGMDYYLDDNGKTKKEIPNVTLIVEIGFLTINFIYLLRGNLIQDMSHTTFNGMHQTYKRNPFGKNIFEVDYYYGYGSLKQLSEDQATLIKTDIETFYNTKQIDEIIFCGGGSLSVFDYFPFKQKILHPDIEGWEEDKNGISAATHANVRGGYKVVKNLWEESGRTEMMKS